MNQRRKLNYSDLSTFSVQRAVRWLIRLFPIILGVVHQLVMLAGRGRENWQDYDKIPVFVDPPGSIRPVVTLEYQWWIVLILIAGSFYALIILRQIPSLPRRFSVPFYVYLLYLLILVKPI